MKEGDSQNLIRDIVILLAQQPFSNRLLLFVGEICIVPSWFLCFFSYSLTTELQYENGDYYMNNSAARSIIEIWVCFSYCVITVIC